MKKKRAHAGHRKKHAAQNHMCRKIRLGYLSADFGMGRARDLLPAFFSGYDQLRYEVPTTRESAEMLNPFPRR